jgi:hypothetical protein
MNVAETILRYVEALVWPAVVVTVMLLFRKEVRRLVTAIRKLRLPGGTEVDIGELVDEAEESAERAKGASQAVEESASLKEEIDRLMSVAAGQRISLTAAALDLDYYRSIALTDPNLALAGLRMGMERALADIAARVNIPQKPQLITTARVAKALAERGVLPQELRSLARELAEITNAAVHGQQITSADALRAIDAAEPLRNFYFAWIAKQNKGRAAEPDNHPLQRTGPAQRSS